MVGSIDPRCETVRGTHWPKKVAWLFGARVAETILASGPKSPHQQAGHMDASDPIRPSKKLLWHGGRPHMQGREYTQLQVELKAIEARLKAWHRANACSQRLTQIPGLGPIGATALVMKTPDPRAFPSGRHFAAWLGLTPKDHSTAGKTRLGKITRAGDEFLRSVLVAGATAVIQQVRRGRGHPSRWLLALLKRKPPKLAAVALANKIARIAWKLMTTGESYDGAPMPRVSAVAA